MKNWKRRWALFLAAALLALSLTGCGGSGDTICYFVIETILLSVS